MASIPSCGQMRTTEVPLQTTRPSWRVSSVSLYWSSGSEGGGESENVKWVGRRQARVSPLGKGSGSRAADGRAGTPMRSPSWARKRQRGKPTPTRPRPERAQDHHPHLPPLTGRAESPAPGSPPTLPPGGLRAPTSHVLDSAVQHQVEQRVEAFQDAAGCGERKGEMAGTLRATVGLRAPGSPGRRPRRRRRRHSPSRPPWNFTRMVLSMYLERSKMLSFFFFSLSCGRSRRTSSPDATRRGRKPPPPATPPPSRPAAHRHLALAGVPAPGAPRHFRPRRSRDPPPPLLQLPAGSAVT